MKKTGIIKSTWARSKYKYNLWLTGKFKDDMGIHYKFLPLIYRICPLFSPEIYTGEILKEAGAMIFSGFGDGANDARMSFEEAGAAFDRAGRSAGTSAEILKQFAQAAKEIR